ELRGVHTTVSEHEPGGCATGARNLLKRRQDVKGERLATTDVLSAAPHAALELQQLALGAGGELARRDRAVQEDVRRDRARRELLRRHRAVGELGGADAARDELDGVLAGP